MTDADKKILAEMVAKYEELQPLIIKAQQLLSQDYQNWPKARPEHQLRENMGKWELMFEALNRASHISEDTTNKKVLLIGCDDPYLPDHYAAEAEMVLSYNRKTQWDDFSNNKKNLVFTDNIQDAYFKAPYDLVIYWDILDHYFEDYVTQKYELSEELGVNHKNFLEMGKQLLRPEGKMFIRCHPWYSRHGGHQNNNVAYNHLLIDESEYYKLQDSRDLITHRICDPVGYYKRLINSLNPANIESCIVENRPESEIIQALISGIKPTWPVNISDDDLLNTLSVEYIDFLLKF
jgi:hypothetical protein